MQNQAPPQAFGCLSKPVPLGQLALGFGTVLTGLHILLALGLLGFSVYGELPQLLQLNWH